MLQIQRRIDVLAEMSRNNPGLSVFATNVRQVRFNAWDYSDDQIWSGLVDHLFRVLAADPDSPSGIPDPATVQAERAQLRRDLEEREAEERRLSDGLRAADRANQPQGLLSWLGSPTYVWRVGAATVRELAHDIRAAAWILLSWAVFAAGAYVIWSHWGSLIGARVAAFAAVIVPALVIAQRLRGWHRAGMGVTKRLRRRLDERQRAISQQMADLRERLTLVDASVRLSAFLTDRAAPDAYQQYRGLLGQVRRDLARLSDDLTAARNEWLASGAATRPPLERIVLYIDDLDRCPPRRVVEVLEAVHLMLALELFVVVVAVDARWLIRSLEYHYRELFSTGNALVFSAPTGSPKPNADAGPASPVDYLDKIFQIPYVLVPPPPAALASYLRALLPPPAFPSIPQAPAMVFTAGQVPSEPAADRDATGKPGATSQKGELNIEDVLADQEPFPYGASSQHANKRSSHGPKERLITERAEEPGVAIPDLRPLRLQLGQPEVEFMTRLGPLLPTPRAAKRLANLYRLVRIGISDSDLATFTGSEVGGPYQVVQILLAVLVGSPAAAQRIFHELMIGMPDSDIMTIFAKAATEDFTERHLCAHIKAELAKIAKDTPMLIATSEYQRWCPTLARYSFHTRTTIAEHSTPDVPSTPHE